MYAIYASIFLQNKSGGFANNLYTCVWQPLYTQIIITPPQAGQIVQVCDARGDAMKGFSWVNKKRLFLF